MKSKITKYILKLSKERDYALSEITNNVCVDDKKSIEKWVQTQDHIYYATRVGTLNEIIRDLKEIIA